VRSVSPQGGDEERIRTAGKIAERNAKAMRASPTLEEILAMCSPPTFTVVKTVDRMEA
jgi:hypothetical protein